MERGNKLYVFIGILRLNKGKVIKTIFTNIFVGMIWGIAKLFGFLPVRAQYLFADMCYYILRYVIKYRLNVVRANLKASFPDYSTEKLNKIELDFYRHLADLMIETLLLASLSIKKMESRMKFVNRECLESASMENGSIAAFAHYASWEYTIVYAARSIFRVYGVYHPLRNAVIDKFYSLARSRFVTVPLPMSRVARQMIDDKKNQIKTIYALIADQTPTRGIIKKWIMFLNQPTAFFMGVERLALKYKMPVIFLDITKVKRGYYQVDAKMIYDGKEQVEEYEITKRYASNLEQMIIREPHLWLWSHKRWKHKPENENDII